MVKTKELEHYIKSGARDNKYRVLLPHFGKEIDILTHSITSPGMAMGVAEVYLKGRKYQLAGDRADDGTFSMTFYNDESLSTRTFFLNLIREIQDFRAPKSVDPIGGGFTGLPFLPDFNDLLGNFGNLMMLNKGAIDYQFNVTIQQLNHKGSIASTTIIHDAFVTSVSEIEYQDETGNISTTTVNFSFTDLTVT